jgi:hypothetical protein
LTSDDSATAANEPRGDLPTGDPTAGYENYAAAVVDAIPRYPGRSDRGGSVDGAATRLPWCATELPLAS